MSLPIMDIEELAKEAHLISIRNGFYDEPPSFIERLYLIGSEVFETGDAWIKRRDEEIPEEIADIFIRLLDFWVYYVDSSRTLDEVIKTKMDKNKNRGYKHGNKRI